MNSEECYKECLKYCDSFSKIGKVKHILTDKEEFGYKTKILHPSNLVKIDKIFDSRCFRNCYIDCENNKNK